MVETHDFDNTVVAIFDDREDARIVEQDLTRAGYHYELLEGDEGKEHLDPAAESKTGAIFRRLIEAFGDRYRVLETLTSELDRGKIVVSVDSEPDEATDAVAVLQRRGGQFIWKLGEWTFTRVSD